MRLRTLVVFAPLLLTLVAPTADAGFRTWGSDLEAEATRSLSNPVDTAYWNLDLPGTRGVRAPATGQVLSARVKGTAVHSGKGDPDARVFLQVLRPRKGGSFRFIVSSGPFQMPFKGDPSQISTFRPENMCIRKGDRLALNTVGGFAPDLGYPNGTPLQVFGVSAGSAFSRFTAAGKTNNGDIARPKHIRRQELLMQARMGTRGDATGLCPGGTRIG